MSTRRRLRLMQDSRVWLLFGVYLNMRSDGVSIRLAFRVDKEFRKSLLVSKLLAVANCCRSALRFDPDDVANGSVDPIQLSKTVQRVPAWRRRFFFNPEPPWREWPQRLGTLCDYAGLAPTSTKTSVAGLVPLLRQA
jgi:hypothetical protein